jgi:hypothetical protein
MRDLSSRSWTWFNDGLDFFLFWYDEVFDYLQLWGSSKILWLCIDFNFNCRKWTGKVIALFKIPLSSSPDSDKHFIYRCFISRFLLDLSFIAIFQLIQARICHKLILVTKSLPCLRTKDLYQNIFVAFWWLNRYLGPANKAIGRSLRKRLVFLGKYFISLMLYILVIFYSIILFQN